MRILIVIICTAFIGKLHAQLCEPNTDCRVLYASEEITNNSVIVSMEISGNGSSIPDRPVVCKLDSDGNKVWETQDDIQGYLHLTNIRLCDIPGNFIYALLTIRETHQNSPTLSQIWKVDKLTGVILWQSQIYQSDSESQFRSIGLFDYDDDRICFYNPLRDLNGGTISGFELFTITKLTNVVTSIYVDNEDLQRINMLSDHQGNIITVTQKYGNSTVPPIVRKFNGLSLDFSVWKYEYVESFTPEIEVEDLIIDNLGNLFMFANVDASLSDNMKLIKIVGTTGDLSWIVNLSTPGKWITERKIFRGELYVTLRDANILSQAHMLKVNMNSGAILWNNENLQFSTPGLAVSCTGTNSDIRSFDFDCDGNIFATGFDKSTYTDFAPGAWGVMKINKFTGVAQSTEVITLDVQYADALSFGHKSHVLNDSLMFIGYIQINPSDRVVTVVKSDELFSTVNLPWIYVDEQIACGSYTWIDGNTYTASNNTATYVTSDVLGCDSVVILDLTINYSSPGVSTDTQTACDAYTWIDGVTYTASNNTATYLTTNIFGCDSTVILDLIVNTSTLGTSIDTQTACNSYTWIDGNTYNASNNTATYALTNAVGCDSMVMLNLTIDSVSDLGVTINEPTLTADITITPSVSFQWLSCPSYTPITNVVSTDPSFTPIQPGDFAVQIMDDGCIDTSACYTILTADLFQSFSTSTFRIFPNPTNESVINIAADDVIRSVRLFDLQGRLVLELTQEDIKTVNVSELAEGEYVVRALSDSSSGVLRFIKVN